MPRSRANRPVPQCRQPCRQHFGIAAGLEPGALGLQFRHQVGEIVDLAIEDNGKRPVHGLHRLDAARQVDEGQAPVAQRDTRLHMDALAIGTAMRHRVRHRLDQGRIEGPRPLAVEHSRQAAHGSGVLFAGVRQNLLRHRHNPLGTVDPGQRFARDRVPGGRTEAYSSAHCRCKASEAPLPARPAPGARTTAHHDHG